MRTIGAIYAEDWFTIAPEHRTKAALSAHINRAIEAADEQRRVFKVWVEMRSRCTDPKHKQYADYGGRGIAVSHEWAGSFEQFIADMGPRPQGGLLERIDNNAGYSAGNCKWANRIEQNSNRRNCVYVDMDGERVTLKEACRRKGLVYRAVIKRIKYRGWSIERALSTPIGKGNSKHGLR